MNKLIFRKLSRDIIVFFLLSSLAISAIIWVIQGVNLLDIVSEQGHAIKIYFYYSILNFPKIYSKLLIFTYFITLFVIISRYEDNNEILIFWTNGIKKISFINFLAKFSLFFVFIQLFLTIFAVPYTQNLAQEFLKTSQIDFFPKLIQEKKFSNVMRNLTIFVEDYEEDGTLNGIYIKEKINENENKIIIASKGKIVRNDYDFSFNLYNGKIINIDKKGSFNLGFKETRYDLSKLSSKTRKEKKLDETTSIFLLKCLNENKHFRKDNDIRCGIEGNAFKVKNIYEEIFKRFINPIYLIILSLISSLVILKSKVNFLQNYYKISLFLIGFIMILFSELSYKFVTYSFLIEVTSIILPLMFVFFFYLLILIKTKFKISHL